MTANDWKQFMLKQKPVETVEKEVAPPQTTILAPPSPIVPPMAAETPTNQATELPPPTFEEEETPFSGGEEESVITAAQDLLTTDSQKMRVATQINSPKIHAYCRMVTTWMRQEGETELAELDDCLVDEIEKSEPAKRGKTNRAVLFAEVLKSVNAHQAEMETAGTAARMMGQK